MPRPIHAIPAVEQVRDPLVRDVLIAMRANLMALYGKLGTTNEQAVMLADLVNAGLVGVTDQGRVYSRINAATVEAAQRIQAGEVVPGTISLVSAHQDMSAGKAPGEYPLDGFELPQDAYVLWAMVDVIEGFTGGAGATVQYGVATDDTDGIKAATPIATFSTGARLACTPAWTVATATQITTAARNLVYTVAGNQITAGKARLYLAYCVTER